MWPRSKKGVLLSGLAESGLHVKEVVPHQEERNWEAIVVGIAEVTMVVS